jgi:hypothetical protein
MTSADLTTRERLRRVAATAAMVLVVLYVVVDVVLQFLPPHYSVVTDAESDLAVGPFGWAMRANFASRAVMSGCVVVAVLLAGRPSRRTVAGSILLAIAGLCSFALVFFDTDVNRSGQFGMSQHTAVGFVHVVFATSGFLAVLAAMILLTSASRGQKWFLAVALGGLLLLAISLLVLPQVVGLTERLCLAGILGWAFVTCAQLRSNPQTTS